MQAILGVWGYPQDFRSMSKKYWLKKSAPNQFPLYAYGIEMAKTIHLFGRFYKIEVNILTHYITSKKLVGIFNYSYTCPYAAWALHRHGA